VKRTRHVEHQTRLKTDDEVRNGNSGMTVV